ncbi:hypothetical protein NS220_16440 [Microbacterium testaceum]|uniref:Uncharacterized protein n=1 Tax=Microbacterium testaceum TaxID=2033 RepID=A0A147ET51_MICTE|nr:hypothetical protein [Microbacterium testaceum]KTR88253.1 hypothetical protein NS220_16440 [Microbacterium testaceum]
MLLSIAVLVMCTLVGAGVIAVIMPRLDAPPPLPDFLRLSAISGILAIGCAALYIIRYNGGGMTSLVSADATMVLSPALFAVALHPPGRRRIPSVLVAIVTAAVIVGSAVLPTDVSLLVKVAALTLVVGLASAGALRATFLPLSARRALAASTALYAVFSFLRLLVALAPVPFPEGVIVAFSPATSALVAIATIGLAVGGIALGRSPSSDPHPTGRTRRRVVICGWRDAQRTFGRDKLAAIVAELRLAARQLDASSVDAWHGVEIGASTGFSALHQHLSVSYGWRAAELDLLCDEPPRTWGRSPSEEHRRDVHRRGERR